MHNGDDSPTDGGRVGEVPHQPQNKTDAEDTDQLQQVPETPSSEDDGNEGDSEGQYRDSDDPGLVSGHGKHDGWVTTIHTGDEVDGLEEAAVDNEVYVDHCGGGPEYTISMRPRVYKGGDGTTDGGRVGETPARVESVAHRDSGGGAQQQQQQQQ